jgi:uncharacterized Zn finger protein (UPF0148 family)
MEKKLCPYCGTILYRTNYGNLLCPNCGIIEEPPKESDDKREVGYVG